MPNSKTTARPPLALTRLTALLDAAVDAMILIDERGHVARFNAAAQGLFGYAEAEVLGRNVSVLMPQPYRAEHDGYLHRYQQTGERRIIGIGREVLAQRKDGSTFPIDLSVGEFEAEGEHGFVGILRDITLRKAQEEQLRRGEENLRLIFENAPTAITIASPDGHITAANAAACALLGFDVAALARFSAAGLIVEEDRALALKAINEVLGGSSQREFAARYRRSDGSVFPALAQVSVARDALGAPLLLICELEDRSALNEAMREAEDLRTRLNHVGRIGTLGEMVSGIAHEVNQPLTAIANYASACRRLLASGRATPEELATTLEKISQQALRAGEVIRGLRNLLKKRDQTRELLDCNQLVREVVRLTDFELRQSGFRLVQTLAPTMPPLLGDGVQIQQVVLNLIRNAFDAMAQQASGEVVEIVTQSDGDWVEIAVSDCGPGIAPGVAEHLFEPFFTTKSQGIGLGLSICKSIVAAHGGALHFANRPQGGTCFTVRLPTATQESGA